MTTAAPAVTAASATLRHSRDQVLAAVKKYWGYTGLRDLQAEAIDAGLERRDSLVVLPTGGGKSLCYQVPPLVAGRTDIVVSPLISLMKDQVDALTACGYPAAALHTGLNEEERRKVSAAAMAGRYRLLFVAPERLLTPWFLGLARRLQVGSFAIDEAHCISQWGHDFRPEYRRLSTLKQAFPEASVHAYTATATPRVRDDIIAQLGLRQPRVLVGTFDRPNLVYRVQPRSDLQQQVLDVARAHAGEAVIVYCISRADTEGLAAWLKQQGVRAAAYHAGMDARQRAATQEQFAAERIDVVVATVAFGMGIDRSNVRCVVHAALPKSIEHYQQETGRAGRDGLEAECILFFSGADQRRWESVMRRSAAEAQTRAESPEQAEALAEALRHQLELLAEMHSFAAGTTCRHRALSRYFGQEYGRDNCSACDICLEERPGVEDGEDIARAIVECVRALRVPFGVNYVADVLRGAASERIGRLNHDQLAQYGALERLSAATVRDFIMQLVEQKVLQRSADERPVLRLAPAAQAVLRGEGQVGLRSAPEPRKAAAAAVAGGWEGVDRGLFEALRLLRRELADERAVPAFVILSDATLRELARLRPVNLSGLRGVRGLGEQKLADLGPRLLDCIRAYVHEHPVSQPRAPRPPGSAANGSKAEALRLFERGASVQEVAQATGRTTSTVVGYLEDYIAERRPASIERWVDDPTYKAVEQAARATGGSLLKPVFEALHGRVDYERIRLVMRHAGLR